MNAESITEFALVEKGSSWSKTELILLWSAFPKILEFLQNWNKIVKEWGESGLIRGRWLNWAFRFCDNYYQGSRIEFIHWMDSNNDALYNINFMVSDNTPELLIDYIPQDVDVVYPSYISSGVDCGWVKPFVFEMEDNSEIAEKEVQEELECCIICTEELTTGCAEMPCCGARIHTRCFSNCIANTTGTDEGNTREKCIFCRGTICDPIQLDYTVEEKIINLRAAAEQSWEEAEIECEKREELQNQCEKLIEKERSSFDRLEIIHSKLRVDYECVLYETKHQKKTIKKMRRGLKGKRKLLKEKVAIQDALREEKRLRSEERYVRCSHPGCCHKPFKLDKNRQSKTYDEHVKGHLMRQLMSVTSIESNIKLNSQATKCQSLVRGYNTRKLSLYRFWKMLKY